MKTLTSSVDSAVVCRLKSPTPTLYRSEGLSGPTDNAPVGFAESLLRGTVTETGIPDDAAALGVLALGEYDVSREVISAAGVPPVDET